MVYKSKFNFILIYLLNWYGKFYFSKSIKIKIEKFIILKFSNNLFDADYYRSVNSDVRDDNIRPFEHFIKYGHSENRNPSIFFESSYYKSHFSNYPKNVNPLVHYHLLGRRRRISPSPWFSYDAYIARNVDVLASKIEPFDHFLRYGVFENRSSCDQFDAPAYVQQNPSVLNLQPSGLHHYILYGKAEGLSGIARSHISGKQASLDANTTNSNERNAKSTALASILKLKRSKKRPLVDVIIPVYRNYFLTLSCIQNALAMQNKTGAEIIVIDDCSPEPELSIALDKVAKAGLVTLIKHSGNKGFVASVNEGMKLHSDRDVILLNSDAEVYGNWIDRLRWVAYREKNISTVTPLTNSGTICSYPNFCRDNSIPNDISLQDLDQIAAKINKGQYVEAPTAVGFCMYIKREALNEVGFFDEKAFGTGYGEENDFCLKAQAKGWKDVICADTVVHHMGSASFLGEKNERVQNAMRVINKRYPGYDQNVQNWIAKDPLKPFRAALDQERLLRLKSDKNILIVTHLRGGGTEQSVNERTAKHVQAGHSVYRLHADAKQKFLASVCHHSARNLPNLPSYDLGNDKGIENLCIALQNFGITKIEIHHLVDFWVHAPAAFLKIVQKLGVEFEFIVHDYQAICPRTNLVSREGIYCGEPDAQGCAQCLKVNSSDFGAPDIKPWRQHYGNLLTAANSIVVPNIDGQIRLNRYFPDLKFSVEPHDEVIAPKRTNFVSPAKDRLRVGVIGAISNVKGLEVLYSVSKFAKRKKLPIDFVVIGYTSNQLRSINAGLKITGPYTNDTVKEIISRENIDVVFFPSTWPEMYCYVLSIALKAGLPIVAFDIGAIAVRLEGHENALLLPVADAQNPEKITANLLKFGSKFVDLKGRK